MLDPEPLAPRMMDSAAILSKIRSRFSEAQEVPAPSEKWVRGDNDLQVKVPADRLGAFADFVRNELGFDLLCFATAVDWIKEERFELVYYVMQSADPTNKFYMKADLPRHGEPTAPSVAAVWKSADWQEREIFDLYGIHFDGHPNLRRILLWEGYPGYPLRKDYVHVPDKYDNGQEIGLPGRTFAETPGGGNHPAPQNAKAETPPVTETPPAEKTSTATKPSTAPKTHVKHPPKE